MKLEINENLRLEIEDVVVDAIIIDALRRVIEYNKPETATHPDDVKDFKQLTRAAKTLLAYYGEPL